MNDIFFFFQEAVIGIRRSALMSFISMATIALSLIVFGVFMVFVVNIHNMSSFLYSKLEVRAYFSTEITPKEKNRIQFNIEQMPEVKKVEFVDKNIAWKSFQKQFRNINVEKWIKKNPLPDSLTVMLDESANMNQVAGRIRGIEHIEDIAYLGDIMSKIHSVAKALKIFGISLVILLTIATFLTIINTIHLTVIARKKEITIMQLVGATPAFIKWPFIIEGFMFGITGALAAIFILKQLLYMVGSRLVSNLPFFPFVYQGSAITMIIWSVIIVGSSIGVLGAMVSVSRSIKQNV